MKKYLLVIALMLSGCAHQFDLYSRDGSAGGSGTANEAGKKITILLDGETYFGTYTYNGGQTIINNSYGTATAYSNNRTVRAYGNSVGTSYIPGSGLGRIFAHANSGKSIRCEFEFHQGSGLGACQDNDNKSYDLVIKN